MAVVVARTLGPIGTLSHRLWPIIPNAPVRLAVNKVHGALQHLHQIPLWVATVQEARVVESGGKVVEAVCALQKEFSGAWLGVEWMAGRVVSEREKAYICTRSSPAPPNRTVRQHGYISLRLEPSDEFELTAACGPSRSGLKYKKLAGFMTMYFTSTFLAAITAAQPKIEYR